MRDFGEGFPLNNPRLAVSLAFDRPKSADLVFLGV
jgi:hypothetical protein